MDFTMKKGSQGYLGNMPFTFKEDTEVEVATDSPDHLAEMLAAAGQKAYGQHIESLARDETVTRNINGVPYEVDVRVSYGAGGARVDTDKGEPRLIGKTFDAPNMASAASAAPSETTAPVVPVAVDPLERAGIFEERTEFKPAVGRFPSEIQTATDEPVNEAGRLVEAGEVSTTGESGTGEREDAGQPVDSDVLPADFPHRADLEANGVTTYSQLEGKTIDDLSGPDFKGIGLVKAQDIVDELKKK